MSIEYSQTFEPLSILDLCKRSCLIHYLQEDETIRGAIHNDKEVADIDQEEVVNAGCHFHNVELQLIAFFLWSLVVLTKKVKLRNTKNLATMNIEIQVWVVSLKYFMRICLLGIWISLPGSMSF